MEWLFKYNYTNSVNGSIYLDYNFGSRPHISRGYDFDASSAIFYIAPPNLITGTLNEVIKSSLIILISLFGLTTLKTSPCLNFVQYLIKTLCYMLVAFTFYTLLIGFLIPFVIYRLLVHGYYRLFKTKCILMHGTDAFWCMDSEEAKSIINILLFLEINDTNDDLKEILTNQMKKLCMDPIYGLKFMSYRRKSRFGYYYWEKGEVMNVGNHLKYIDESIKTKNDLNTFISQIVNKEIKGFGWEIHVSRSNIDNSNLRPIVFRLHHSIGDGASILQVLIDTVSDKASSEISLNKITNGPIKSRYTYFIKRTPKSEPILIRMNKIIHSIKLNIIKIPSFIFGPLNLINQVFNNDYVSKLSVSRLSGNKVVTWVNDKDTLKHIKLIKRQTNSRFSDVVFSLFSKSIWKHFEEQNIQLPEYINVVVPIFGDQRHLKVTSEIVKQEENIRISKISEVNEGMRNSFWVAILKLPIRMKNSKGSFESVMGFVKESTQTLRVSTDFIMYKFMLSVLVTLIPGYIVKPMFDVAKSHMVFSNLPGPQNEIKIAGIKVAEMTFWLPNRGTTGLGLSLLSNNNRLSIGLMADKAVIPNQQDLQNILDHFINQAKLICK